MSDLVPCLVVNSRGEWRVEERPPVPPRIPPQFDWSSELQSAAKFYRRNGEDLKRSKLRRASGKIARVG